MPFGIAMAVSISCCFATTTFFILLFSVVMALPNAERSSLRETFRCLGRGVLWTRSGISSSSSMRSCS